MNRMDRGCGKKVRHQSFGSALSAARDMESKSRKSTRAQFRAYKCAICGYYHIGRSRRNWWVKYYPYSLEEIHNNGQS